MENHGQGPVGNYWENENGGIIWNRGDEWLAGSKGVGRERRKLNCGSVEHDGQARRVNNSGKGGLDTVGRMFP